MPLPFRFISGELAKASEVNANFDYIMDMLGQLSGPGQIEPAGSFVMGPRRTATLSASHDQGGYETDFFQISWNATWTNQGGTYVFDRRLPNLGGSALRLGIRGLEVFATQDRTSNMNSTMQKIFRVSHDDAGRFIFSPRNARMSLTDGFPHNLEDNALRTVLLDNPIPIYDNVAVGQGTTTYAATNYGIPREAQALIIRAHITAYGSSGAGMMFYRKSGGGQGNLQGHLEQIRGFVVHAPITGSGIGMRAGGQGVVPLGRAAEEGRFVIHRTAGFYTAVVHIVGYMI